MLQQIARNLSTVASVTPISYKAQFLLWQATLIGILLTAIILLSIGGNILVCVAILTDRKLKKVSNLFLISLAISDLVVSSLVMPFAVGNDILGYWPFAQGFCDVWISLDILSATASILNLCAISLDRYIHMKVPFRYEEWMTYRKCLAFIAIIWLVSILISFLPINLGWHGHPVKDLLSNTTIQSSNATTEVTSSLLTLVNATMPDSTKEVQPPSCSMELNQIYSVTSSSLSFYIPCIVMVAIYIKMYNLARYHAESIQRTQAFVTSGGKSKIGENKALFTLGMIMGLFLLSWIPFFIVNLVSSFCVDCVPPKLFVAFTWLGYLNSTMNPIIYSKFNADFREAFRRILCCQRCRVSDPYDFKPRSRASSNVAMKKLTHKDDKTANGRANGSSQQNGNGYTNNNQLECKELAESQSLIGKEEASDTVIEFTD